MSPMPQIDFLQMIRTIQEDVSLVVSVFREKGVGHFGRPIVVGVMLVFASYNIIYIPAKKKSASLNALIKTAQSVSQYAEDYRARRDRLAWAYTQLPRIEDREEWLFKSLVESLKAENIVAQKLPPMTENELGGLITQQATMNSTVKFMEAIRWLNRIESGRPLIHVNSVSIVKKQGAVIGTTDVNCEITTIIPKKRLDQ
ncbi:MAG: hypothetical protein HZB91_08390 [Elusimicrobia bacterium]|nr:hypothetical protein [Elusimicrobiota bacterium]